MLRELESAYSRRARQKRARIFRERLRLRGDERILDLGSEDGSHIASVVGQRANVVLADISGELLDRGHAKYGFDTVLIDESGRLPFPDGHFDVVFCSSVIEHVSVDKQQADSLTSGSEFAREAFARQREFAQEIRRVAKRYFVQTPNRYFPIESHTWLPGLIVFVPRPSQIRIIHFFNRFWPKKTAPDWNLLTRRQMSQLFPDAEIVVERSLGLSKSLIAVRNGGGSASNGAIQNVGSEYWRAHEIAQERLSELVLRRAPLRVLDAGCGRDTRFDFGSAAYTVGIDISPQQLENNDSVDETIAGDVQEHTWEPQSFDVIVCWDVLEHLPHPERAIARFGEALRPGGLVLLGLPHVRSLKGVVTRFTPHVIHSWAYRRLKIGVGRGGQREPFPTFLRSSLKPSRLHRTASAHGLTVRDLITYESWFQRTARERLKLTGWRWRLVQWLVTALSLGRLEAGITDLVVVLERSDQPASPTGRAVDRADVVA